MLEIGKFSYFSWYAYLLTFSCICHTKHNKNMSTSTPYIVIVSSSNTKPKSLIKLMTKNAGEVEENPVSEKICHPFVIDTKYYTADVTLCGITDKFKRTDEFNNNVEAVIIHMDSNKTTGLEDLEVWQPLLEDCDPEIKILLTNYCNFDTKVNRSKATDWCIKRGFELIELYPTNKPVIDADQDIIEEKIGVDRVIEVLQTHVWSNLVMKERQSTTKPPQIEDNPLFDNIFTKEVTDDFNELFSQLHMMKNSLQSMPSLQRKHCAEQMVTAFWKAIGGDEEEILDM